MCNFPCFQTQAKQSIRVKLPGKSETRLDSRVGKNPENAMSSNNILDTLLLLIFTSCSSLLLLLARVFNKIQYPQIPMGTAMTAIFGYHPPAYAIGVITRSFSTSIPNPWSPPAQRLAIKIKSVHHSRLQTCFTCLSNPPDVHGFPPSRQRTYIEGMFIFKKIFS